MNHLKGGAPEIIKNKKIKTCYSYSKVELSSILNRKTLITFN